MGLDIRALGALAANVGMELAGNAKSTVTLHIGGTHTYDPTTDSAGPTGTTDVEVEALAYKSQDQRDDSAKGEDATTNSRSRSMLIEAADMPAGTKITEADTVTEDGLTWLIFDATLDPAGALWVLDLRR